MILSITNGFSAKLIKLSWMRVTLSALVHCGFQLMQGI